MGLHSGATDTVIKSFAGDPNGNVNIEASEANTAELLYDSVNGTLYAGDASNNGTNNNWDAVVSGAGPAPLYSAPGTPEYWFTGTDVVRTGTMFITTLTDQSANSNDCSFGSDPELVLGVTGPNDSKGFANSYTPNFPSAANVTPPTASDTWTIVFAGSFPNSLGQNNRCSLIAEVAVSGGTNTLQIDAGVTAGNLQITWDNDPANFGDPLNSNSTATDDDLHIYIVRADPTQVEFFQDGVPIGNPASSGPNTAYTLDSLFYDYTSQFCITDILAYSSSVSNADLNTLGNAMQAFLGTPTWTDLV